MKNMATKKPRLSDDQIASTDLVKIALILCVLGLGAAYLTGEEVREENQCGEQK